MTAKNDTTKDAKNTMKRFASYLKDHEEAVSFLYDPSEETDRKLFFLSMTAEKAEKCFKDPLLEIQKDCLSLKTKTEEEQEEKINQIYDNFTVYELIDLYEYYRPQKTKVIPTSSSLSVIEQVFSAFAFGNIPAGMILDQVENGNGVSILYESEDEKNKTYLEIKDKALLEMLLSESQNPGNKFRHYREFRKFLSFFLMLINERNFESPIVFDVRIMVYEYKMYSRPDVAKNAALKYLKMIRDGFSVSAYSKKGKEEEYSGGGETPGLIAQFEIPLRSSVATVYLNEAFNMGVLFEYFTILPKWAFSLDINPYSLIHCIFKRARHEYNRSKANIDPKKEKYTFNIGFETIIKEMGFDQEDKNSKDSYNKIRLPITSAIESIEKEIRKNHDHDIKLEPSIRGGKIEDVSTSRFIHEGYLKVILSGNYLSYFENIKQKKDKIDADYEKKQKKLEEERIKRMAEAEAAKAKALLENQEK